MTVTKVAPQDDFILIRDRLIELFLLRWHVPLVAIWLGTSLIPLGGFALLAVITHSFAAYPRGIAFSKDYNLFNGLLLGVPATCVFYCLFPKYLKDCLIQLYHNGVIGNAKKTQAENEGGTYDFRTFLCEASNSLSSKVWPVASFVAAAIFMAIALPQHMRSKSWIVQNSVSLVAIEVFWFITFAIGILLMLRIGAGIWWINKAFRRFHIVVRPLYPDKVGGLRPLSQFSLQLGMIIFVYGLLVGSNQFTTHFVRTGVIGGMEWAPDIIIPWILYLLLAPVAFFAPLTAAHEGMRDAKERELLVLAEQFECQYRALCDELMGNAQDVNERTERIAAIRRMYEVASSFPVWPFQFQKLAQFFVTVLLPVLLTVASSIVVAMLRQWFGK